MSTIDKTTKQLPNESLSNENLSNEALPNAEDTKIKSKPIQNKNKQTNIATKTTLSDLAGVSSPTSTPSPTPSIENKGSNEVPHPSKIYPIVCVICGILFVAAVYYYIYATRNKTYNRRKGRASRKTRDRVIDVRVDKYSSNKGSSYGPLSKNSTHLNSNFNISSKNSVNNSNDTLVYGGPIDDRNNSLGHYSDTNNLLDNNRNNMTFNNKTKKQHYPNPLFEHTKPYNTFNMTGFYNQEGDITDGEKLKNQNIQITSDSQFMKNGNNAMNYNTNNGIHKNIINTNANNKPNKNVINESPEIHSKIPDVNVAPFNYMDPNDSSELFKAETDSDELSMYDDTFIRKLGPELKIETKKVEYTSAEDELINKIRIKRINH